MRADPLTPWQLALIARSALPSSWLCVQVGFIGLGNMGSRMVANLRQGGHQLVVHDRSISAMEEAVKDGAETASSPADMASQEGN